MPVINRHGRAWQRFAVGTGCLLGLLLFMACSDQQPPTPSCLQSCGATCDGVWSCTIDGECRCGYDEDGEAVDLEPELEPGPAYLYLRIDDVTSSPTGENKGADLDAVVLFKASGERIYAEHVESFRLGAGEPLADDPLQILGPPDAFFEWQPGHPGDCDFDSRLFVALGQGGSIIVRMGAKLEAGDRLTILELTWCRLVSGNMASDDAMEVFASTSADASATWIPVGGGIGPEVLINVPALP